MQTRIKHNFPNSPEHHVKRIRSHAINKTDKTKNVHITPESNDIAQNNLEEENIREMKIEEEIFSWC